MSSDAFKGSLRALQKNGFFKHLRILRGIERESLRVDNEGNLSQKKHQLFDIPLEALNLVAVLESRL